MSKVPITIPIVIIATIVYILIYHIFIQNTSLNGILT